MCIDHLVVKQASDPAMGRGAFAKRRLSKGTVVAPSPLQIFENRAIFAATTGSNLSEDLFINYCFQPANSSLVLFPYGQGFGLINYNSDPSKINARLRWSTNHMNHSPQWIDEGEERRERREVAFTEYWS